MAKRPIALAKLRPVPRQFRWVDQRRVRAHVRDQLRHEAGALSRFLLPVADAQGLRVYADSSLGQRLSMPRAGLHQARPALIQLGWVASQRPLSQVFALAAAPRGAPPNASAVAADDAPVAIQAVCARIWEVWG
jgi:hypothetical protein